MVVSETDREDPDSNRAPVPAPPPAPAAASQRRRRGPRVVYAPLGPPDSSNARYPTHLDSSDDESLEARPSAPRDRGLSARAILSQNQRARADLGLHGVGDDPRSRETASSFDRERSSSRGRLPGDPPRPPWITQRYLDQYRRQQSPDSETSSTGFEYGNTNHSSAPYTRPNANTDPSSTLSDLLRRGRDQSAARVAASSSMQRSVSGASLGGRPLTQPGVTLPAFSGLPRPLSGRATTDLTPRSMPQSMQPGPNAELYILSSAEGPQYLLLSPATQESYLTSRNSQTNLSALSTPRSTAAPPWLAGIREHARQLTAPHAGIPHHLQHQHHNNEQLPGPPQPQLLPQPLPQPAALQQPAANLHPNNPLGGGFPALLARVLPHVWSLIQLGFFVWLFTASSTSWVRIVLIVSLAVAVFIFNTGWLNEPLQRVWQPVGRHLDDIFPAIDRRHGIPRPGAANAEAIAAAPNQDPDPAQLAARMVAERRAHESWFTGQLRRLERAGLLFLASFAPGVAERHIANLEAEARAEETRRREAAAAAAAAAEEEEARATAEPRSEEDEDEEEDDEEYDFDYEDDNYEAEDSDADESSEEDPTAGKTSSATRINGQSQNGLRERKQPYLQSAQS